MLIEKKNDKKEDIMKIVIQKDNYKHLLQCIYLGNLVINGNKEIGEPVTEHEQFVNDIYKQFIEKVPARKLNYEFKNLVLEDTLERRLADFSDQLYDSVQSYFKNFENELFCEMLSDKIADKNYPVFEHNEGAAFDNLLAKNLYQKIIKACGTDFISFKAPKINEEIEKTKVNIKR